MKKLIFLALLCFPVLFYGQTNTQNWIKKTIYREAGSGRPKTTIIYHDGLGRKIQEVAHQQSTSGKDIVTHFEYDLDRQLKDYLPYPTSTSDRSFRSDARSETLGYSEYNGQYPVSEKVLEKSPLERVLKQGAVGADWQINPDSDADRAIKFDYETNRELEVKNYFAITTWDPVGRVYNTQLQDKGFYSVNQLFKTITRDENWKNGNHNSSIEFKDKEGRLVLKRLYNNGVHDVYYVYDIYGNLSYVLPPLVSNPGSELDALCYQYRYDHRNRLVEKKLPGKQWEYQVFDKLDRIVATGPAKSPFDGLQVGWMINKYDALNRNVYTGWMQSNVTRKDLQNQYDNEISNFSEKRLRPGSSENIDNVSIGYSNLVYPISGYKLLTVNYYDNYVFPNAPATPSTVEGAEVATSVNGFATGVWNRIVTSPSETLNEQTFIFYDVKGRKIRSLVNNHFGGYTQTDNKLNFLGNPIYVKTIHKLKESSTALTVEDYFVYDTQDRLLVQTKKVNGGIEELISSNEYDELGKLISKKVGGSDTSGNQGLQKIDYRYNIKGWLTDINNNEPIGSPNLSLDSSDLFGLKINYNKVSSSENGRILDASSSINGKVIPLYTGHIAETLWRSASDNVLRKYGFEYDALYRLNEATYQKPLSSNPIPGSYNEKITYDKNGNILTFNRQGNLDNPVLAITIDELSYVYDGNKVKRINDATNNPEGFKDNGFGNMFDDYAYDENANLTKDENKGITNITYNHLNLPLEIFFSSGNKISYLYNATGNKVRKSVSNAGTKRVTDYQGGFQYVDNDLKFFAHSEGYVNVTEGILFNYVYNFKDHLGNIRLSWAFNAKTGGLKILEENHYYPFGLKHTAYNTENYIFTLPFDGSPGYNAPVLAEVGSNGLESHYKFKYNGKEYQDELGLNLYNYGWRNYDPAIGRWTTPDPLLNDLNFTFDPNEVDKSDVEGLIESAETTLANGGGIFNPQNLNPFVYGYNNPLSFDDPDGRCPICIIAVLLLAAEPALAPTNNKAGDAKALGEAKINKFDTMTSALPMGNAKTGFQAAVGVTKKEVAKKVGQGLADDVKESAKQSAASEAKSIIKEGRTGKQARLKEIADDPKVGKADKGWIKSEMNQMKGGNRKSIRNPPGKDLAHERGREAAKGYSYKYSNLQNRTDHRNQHKYDKGGKLNKERKPD